MLLEPNEEEKDHAAGRRGNSCSNPGQYTGSCSGGPPDPAYWAQAEKDAEDKVAGQAQARSEGEQ